MVGDYTENSLVEQPAIALFSELGWEAANCFYESFNDSPSPLSSPKGRGKDIGRETPYYVVLEPKLRVALRRLNPGLADEAINFAVEELTKDRSLMSPAQANREVYKLLKEGIRVDLSSTLTSDPSPTGRGEDVVRVRVIDWDNPGNNDFFLASQLWISGDMYKRRADLVGFVNGIPLVFIELKAFHKNLEDAFQDNLRDYKTTIPQVFWYNALVILSNGSDSRIGTITAGEKKGREPFLRLRQLRRTNHPRQGQPRHLPAQRGNPRRVGQSARSRRIGPGNRRRP
ncbi:MAG: hypothetical protein A2038_04180 [Deltaproteobacteria bacterium GWA2_57_13]|nr:MAG: hypothetical protein A2038_04180 [Deltaproteobacteria bacterium GWA2_57_13]